MTIDTTSTANPTDADTDAKIVEIKGTKYDLASAVGILSAALSIESINPAQRQAYDMMKLGGMPDDVIANVLSQGLIKDLRAAIKASRKPDHDAIWYASNIHYGVGDYTLESFVGTIRSMINAANISMAEYNELNKDTGANIRPFTLDGGTSRKRAAGDRADRSYVRLVRALLDKKITTIYNRARKVQFNIRQRNTDGVIVYEFQHDGKWLHVSELNKVNTKICTDANVSAPDTWRACTVSTGKDEYTMLCDWYDTNVKDETASA